MASATIKRDWNSEKPMNSRPLVGNALTRLVLSATSSDILRKAPVAMVLRD
jgi:hypothetical protein